MMKKLRFLLSILIVILFMFSVTPVTFAEEDFSYNITNGEVTITRFGEGLKGEYSIPETVNGLPVTVVGDNAFSYHHTEITTLHIPKTVKFFGNIYSPLQGISTLEKITVDEENEFFVSDENGVLYTKDMTQLLHFPQNSQITEYAVPDGVETFLTGAFSGVKNLKTITLPSSVTDVGGNDFYTGFFNCKSLEKVIVSGENSVYSSDDNGALYSKDKSIIYYYPSANIQKTFVIPDSVTVCYVGAFNHSMCIENVDMNNLKSVPNDVFVKCPELKEIRVSERTKRFNSNIFSDCPNAEKIYFEGTAKQWKGMLYPAKDISVPVVCLKKEVTTIKETTTVQEETTVNETTTEETTDETTLKQSEPVSQNIKEKPKFYIIIPVALLILAGAVTVIIFKNKKK